MAKKEYNNPKKENNNTGKEDSKKQEGSIDQPAPKIPYGPAQFAQGQPPAMAELPKLTKEQEEKLKAIFSHAAGEEIKEAQTPYELENKQDEIKTTYEAVEERNPRNYSVLSLMQDARVALTSKNMDNAKHLYSKINALYKKLPATSEKKRLYYEILELKTDIELAGV